MIKKREIVIHRDRIVVIIDRKFASKIREREVRVLARAEGWAMVRPKGFATYCCPEKELFPLPSTPPQEAE